MFILDTNVISELRKAGDGKADANVVAWLSSVDAGALYLSAITLMEIELGVLRIERRDPSKGPSFAPGWIIASCRNLRIGPCPSTWPWRSGAHPFMFQTRAPSATRSSQRPRWCTA